MPRITSVPLFSFLRRAIVRSTPLVAALLLATWLGTPGALAGEAPSSTDHAAMDHAAIDHQQDGAGTPSCHGPAKTPADGEPVAIGELAIPDLALVDQDGQSRRFVSEVLAGRKVAINFVFTTCTTVCPPMGATFGRLQDLLGERLGPEVTMVSVSIDPVVDTPERLAEWSARFGRREGWTLLTGPKPEVDRLLKALQVFTPDATDHAPTVLLGDPTSGRWERAYGLASPQQMVFLLDALGADGEGEGTIEGVGR